MGTIARLNVALAMDSKDFESGVKNATAAGESLSSKLGKIGQGMTAGVTLPLVGAAAAALKFSTDLNTGMANIASLGVASDRVTELKGNIQSMAITTGKSTDDLAQGAYQVISAFGDTADTAAILEINAKSAAAGLADTSEAIALTSAVTKGYGDTSAKAVQQASDLALQTVALGQTTFPELAGSIGAVTPLAANLGVAQEELFAVMATGTGVTGNASAVSTQMRGTLQSLMAPTEDMTKLMESMGYSTAQAMIQGEGYQGTMAAIIAASKASNTPLQKYIGSIEGQTLALALGGPLADSYAEKLDAMGSAAGATDKAFAAQTQGINKTGFTMKQLAIKAQVVAQKIGDGLAPALAAVFDIVSPLIDKVVELADWFSQADAATQTWIVGALALVAALGPLLAMAPAIATAFGVLGAVIGALVSPIGLLIAAVGALVAVFATDFMGIRTAVVGFAKSLWDMSGINLDGIADAFQSLGKYIGAVLEDGDYLNDWITHLPEPIQPAVEAIGKFIAGLKDIYDTIVSFASGNLDITELIWNIANVLTGGNADYYAIRDALQAISDKWDDVRGVFSAIWVWAQETLPNAFETMRAKAAETWATFSSAVKSAWDATLPILTGLWAFVQVAIPAAVVWLQDKWAAAWPVISGAVVTAWDAIKGVFSALWVWAQETLPGAFAAIQESMPVAWAAISSAITTSWETIKSTFLAMWVWAQETLPGAFATLQEKGAAGWDAIGAAITAAQTTLDTAWTAMEPIFTKIGEVMAPALQRFGDALATIPATFTDLLPKVQELGGAFGELALAVAPLVAVVGGVLVIAVNFGVNMFAAAMERLPGIVGPIIDQITATIKLITTVITEVIDAVKAIAAGDWATAWNSLKTVVGALAMFIAATWTNITTMVSNVGGAVGDAVTSTLSDLGLTDAATAVQGVIDKITALGTKIKNVLSGKETLSITLPKWITDLQAWTWPALPSSPIEWLTTLMTWTWPILFGAPAWVVTLMAWLWPEFPKLPEWLTDLFDFEWPSFPAMPDWIGRLLGWVWPTAPGTPAAAQGGATTPGTATNGGYPVDVTPPPPTYDPYKAVGGPVSSGVPYIVGEKGRELFVPNVNGSIIPNNELGGMWDMASMGGGGGAPMIGVANVYNQVDIRALAYQVAEYQARRR